MESGDVILVINGMPAVDLAGNPKMIDEVLSGDSIDIVLVRTGEIENVTVLLR